MQRSVLEYFENTKNSFPNKIAIDDGNLNFTFTELKDVSLQIAYLIREKTDLQKKPIFVYLPKTSEIIAAFIGVLYTGNFYTPTDVKFPFKKVESVMEQLGPEIIVTNSYYKGILVKNGVDENKIVNIDERSSENMYSDDFPLVIDTDVVYTLFTSGSTGIPKGVSICNRSIIDYIDWAKNIYHVTDKDKIGNQAPFYFDNSTLDIYLMMSTGASLYIIPESFFSFPAKLLQYIVEKQINMIFWVPSVFVTVSNSDLLTKIDCSCLDKILFAGEVMPNKHLNYWRRNIPNALYSNLYGPTEITVDCTYYIVDRDFSDDEPLPIGKPCRNSDVMLLDDNDNLITAEGVVGELCVRGSSLALGYWNNPIKTSEVFVQNPLNKNLPEIIYKTGDLVYYNDRNEIMFAGRKDFQIKHMGYRIELGEIETAVGCIEEIKNVCISYDTDEKKIVMFYQADCAVEEKYIRKKLLNTIPKYMVPAEYINVEKFTYTDNGKIDRKRMLEEYKTQMM